MRNQFTGSATRKRKHRAQTSQESVTESGRSRSDGEAPPKRTCASGLSARALELRPRRAEHVRIAPVFLHAAPRKSEGIHVGEKHKPAAFASRSDDVKGRQTSPLPRLFEEGAWSRQQLSPSILNICLEDIQTSNPAFPVRAVFSTLQKRAGLQQSPPAEEVSPCEATSEHQRMEGRREPDIKGGLAVKHHPGSSKLSRAHRLKQPLTAPDRRWTAATGSSFEDVLWTDKYSPRRPGEVIGNSASVNALHSWLKKWKLRADTEDRRKVDGGEQGDIGNDSWDRGDFQGEAGADDESLCNAVLVTGPPGVGKTASVYACALELGFKVFEVNCSSLRSGRHVLSQLKEATQSHLVETSGKDLLKPAYFQTYTTNSCSAKSETSPGNSAAARPQSVQRKRGKLNRGRHRGKAKPAAGTLAAYFKMKAKADHLCFGGLSSTSEPNINKLSKAPRDRGRTVTATSLILFEEVDVIFEDDVGFLAAVKTFMTTTKRPVILTTTDPLFRERFSDGLDEITFKVPSAVSVCSYLRLVALAENVRLQPDDVSDLLSLTGGDVRRCLLQLQLWASSGGGRPHADRAGVGSDPQQVPSRETGCTSCLLGLEAVTQIQLQSYLERPYWSDVDMNQLLMLLAESWRHRLPLLYSNLELLLPVGGLSGAELGLSDTDLHNHPSSGKVISNATDNKHVTKSSRLSRTRRNRAQASSNKTEPEAGVLVALTDFFDLMSYLDAIACGSSRPEDFVWTGAEVKDGLLDERREEEGRSRSHENQLSIQAAVEGLGCHRCCRLLSEAWTEGRQRRRTTEDKWWERPAAPPAASKRQSLSFSVQPLCAPHVSQRRHELSRAVFASESFSLMGNRRAVGVDYMPTLRSICRLQRARQHNEEPVGCMNYLSGTCLGLSKSTMKLLAEDF